MGGAGASRSALLIALDLGDIKRMGHDVRRARRRMNPVSKEGPGASRPCSAAPTDIEERAGGVGRLGRCKPQDHPRDLYRFRLL